MDKKKFIARKSIGEYISILAAVLAVISLIYYYSYTSSMGTTNTMVIILLLVSTICNIVYFAVDIELRLWHLYVIQLYLQPFSLTAGAIWLIC